MMGQQEIDVVQCCGVTDLVIFDVAAMILPLDLNTLKRIHLPKTCSWTQTKTCSSLKLFMSFYELLRELAF